MSRGWSRGVAVVVAVLLLGAPVVAIATDVSIDVFADYGELVEGSPIRVSVRPDDAAVDCAVDPIVRRTTSTVAISVQKNATLTSGDCAARHPVAIGTLTVARLDRRRPRHVRARPAVVTGRLRPAAA